MQEVIAKRTRNSKTHSLGGRKFTWDGTIGSVHYWDNEWKEIDNEFLPVAAPWNWQMLKAGYHIRVKEGFNTGQIIEFEKQGETVQFQPMALEWTNDLDQIQQVSMPQNVSPVITNPEVDLLPAVGVPSHQGTIRWNDAYGQGIDFQWRCTPTRLAKILEIENLNKLPVPQQYIIDGGNPVLRLNLIFDPPSKQDVDIVVDGQVWNQRSDTQTFTTIEFVKDGEVLWGFMPLRYWGSGSDPETNEGQSVATLEKRGNKLYISIRVPYGWLQSAVYPVFIDIDVNEQVGASEDDASEFSDGSISLTSIGFIMGDHFSYGRFGGVRFSSVTIASGASIDTAYLQFLAAFSDSGAFECDLYGEDGATPVSFTTNTNDITGRTKTATAVQCDSTDLGNWSSGINYNSPEIKTIVQELVDSYNYSSGAPIVVLAIWQTGTGERIAVTYDNSPINAPKLHIEYTVGAPPEGQPYISRVQGVQGMRSWGGI